MSCSAVRSIYDAPTPDKAQVREVANTIYRIMAKLDAERAKSGKLMILARLSDGALTKMAALVTVRCGDHSSETLEQSARTIFQGYEDLYSITGE